MSDVRRLSMCAHAMPTHSELLQARMVPEPHQSPELLDVLKWSLDGVEMANVGENWRVRTSAYILR